MCSLSPALLTLHAHFTLTLTKLLHGVQTMTSHLLQPKLGNSLLTSDACQTPKHVYI